MTKLTIDGKELDVPAGYTVIQACEMAGVEIPRFCYHERLEIAGNCRMCLVEVSPGPPKPQASCALPVAEGMTIKTDTPMVKKAREGVMEFLLINHPLDCPICDQAGECDLQDQAMAYGHGVSRYHESKRAVEEKYLGPLVKTEMTRCIHCTRCVRFITDVAGVPELGATGRGEHMEITTYVEKALTSELSGNIIDLCPVGALTSKPYAFLARPWELRKTESVDVLDAVGSNIRVDSRGDAVLRILPRLNEDINEEWISDKTRFACDGLRAQRLDRPYVRVDGKLQETVWPQAFAAVAEKIKGVNPKRIAALAGNLACVESMTALKDLMGALGSPNLDCRQDGAKIDSANRSDYIFNTTIAGIEEADVCLLIGVNPRKEAALINARLRKRYLQGNFRLFNIGAPADLTYPVEELGNDPRILEDIESGKHPVSKALQEAKKPMLIMGMAALARPDGADIMAHAQRVAGIYGLANEGWNGINVLHNAAARVGGLDIGFLPAEGGSDISGIIDTSKNGGLDVLFLLGVDEIDMALFGANTFVVYIGHHGDDGAHRADVILPGAAYTEKNATYVNTEGRVQRTLRAVFPPGEAKEDWTIFRALSEVLEITLPYDTLEQVRIRMGEIAPHLDDVTGIARTQRSLPRHKLAALSSEPFEEVFSNFYRTDPISRASKTMAECTALIMGEKKRAA